MPISKHGRFLGDLRLEKGTCLVKNLRDKFIIWYPNIKKHLKDS